FILSYCLLMSPSSLLTAQALQGQTQSEILLSQANTTETDLETTSTEDIESNSNNATSGRGTYNLEFKRVPNVSKRMRLRGIYAEDSISFTRPRNWDVSNLKAVIRFQNSIALDPRHSNLTVLVNDKAVGSVILDRKGTTTGELLVNIPPNLLQNYNELKLVARQRTDEYCVDPFDPNLWTEIQLDSKLLFNYKLKPASENFTNYPYPIVDELNLQSNQINYLQPNQIATKWLTAASRLQASLGRNPNFRSLNEKLVSDIASVKPGEKLVVIGTPSQQPALAELDLPLNVEGNQILDINDNPLPEDRGVLMLTSTKNGAAVLVVTGNGEEAIEKATQFLIKSKTNQIGTGPVVLVDKVPESTTLEEREWPGYLPKENSFKLSDIEAENDEKFKDVTVRGYGARPVVIDFKALPNDRFLRGSSMNLVYSYGPQLNPRTSTVEVLLDGNFIGGERLSSEVGESRKTLKVDLPPKLIKPNSKIEVFFRMSPREDINRRECHFTPTEQLVGKVHKETNFNLKRESSAKLPDLQLLQYGFPFASPQDLSKTKIVVPENPSETDVLTLLEFSERLGRLSKASSVELDVHTSKTLSDREEIKNNNHIVAIGTQKNFPLPEVLEKSQGLNLQTSFQRLFGSKEEKEQAQIQAPIDGQGMIKEIISPWNDERVVLALTAQTEFGLDRVRQVLSRDPWFFQLKQDTVLISSDQKNPLPDDENAFELDFFNNAPKTRRVEKSNPLSQMSRFLEENWLLLPLGIIGIALLVYGIAQLYLKRRDETNS
ncbi:MAG: cellulose biosynthesis cyclic di-GMP-binding regulatory protein BcsB, partial [Cyanobacteriota bacterium]|nr:cellulose biosynthesis cyclic di-GMP-binding regulatory protein BcsB [Cyanobacteriota bacterium]